MKLPNIIDLYAGVGGLSLGAARAGFRVLAAVENDPYALETHKKNFPETLHLDLDISKLSGKELMAAVGLDTLEGLIGGPPCQGFSNIGLQTNGDARNGLFSHFFKLVAEIRPKFYLAENVPGILSSKYDDFRKQALKQIPKEYTVLPAFKINANEYGVPTTRKRVFFIGYKTNCFEQFKPESFKADPDLTPVFVEDALRGLLKSIDPDWQSEEEGWRKVQKLPKTCFYDKVSGEIPYLVGHQDSVEKYLIKHLVSGCMGTRHTPLVAERYGKVKNGKSDPVSKSVKLDPKGFCPTLRAGTGKDKGSYQAVRPLHPTENRVITPREAARLQGFPDWFVFHRTKWHSFRQIGNSVSPIIAELLLKTIKSYQIDTFVK
jgi:DNA (cytosine-5)-methyltransferase 1